MEQEQEKERGTGEPFLHRGTATWFGRGITITILLFASLGAYWLGAVTRVDGPTAAGLHIPDDRLRFGEVWEDRAFQWTLPIENRARKEIKVVEFVSSCSCVNVRPNSLRLSAGEVRDVQLTLDLTRTESNGGGRSSRAFQIHLVPRIHGAVAREAGWLVVGMVRKQLIFNPDIAAVRTIQGVSGRPTIVKAESAIPLRELRGKSTSPEIDVQVFATPGEDQIYQIGVEPRRVGAIGRFRADIVLQAIPVDGSRIPEMILRVDGFRRADVQAFPNAVEFGAHPVGSDQEEFVTLASETGRDFEVVAVEATAGVSVIPEQGWTGTQKIFRIKQRFGQTGEIEGKVRYSVRGRLSSETAEVVVPIQGLGLPN